MDIYKIQDEIFTDVKNDLSETYRNNISQFKENFEYVINKFKKRTKKSTFEQYIRNNLNEQCNRSVGIEDIISIIKRKIEWNEILKQLEIEYEELFGEKYVEKEE